MSAVHKWLTYTCLTTSSPCTLKRSKHKTVKNMELKSCTSYDRVPQEVRDPAHEVVHRSDAREGDQSI